MNHGRIDAWLNTTTGARVEHQGVPADKKFPNVLLAILYRESEAWYSLADPVIPQNSWELQSWEPSNCTNSEYCLIPVALHALQGPTTQV